MELAQVLDDVKGAHPGAVIEQDAAAALRHLADGLVATSTTTNAPSWADVVGPVLTPGAVLGLLGISRAGLDKRRSRDAVLGIQTANGRWVYPLRQFVAHDGRVQVTPHLPPVLTILTPAAGRLAAARWLGSPNRRLAGRTPWEALHDGRDQAELLAAAAAQADAWGAST